MKASTLLILGAAGAGAYFLLRKPGTSSTAQDKPGTSSTAQNKQTLTFQAVQRPGRTFSTTSNVGKSPAPQVSSPGGRDIASGLAAAGAGAACATVPGVGALAAPLCGADGAYLGGKAYDYGKKAWDEVASWF